MVVYEEAIAKKEKKGFIPKPIFVHIHNVFIALDTTKDMGLFDIKQLKVVSDFDRVYYRLRKGKYRAIFYFDEETINVIDLDKREDVYKKWQ